MLSLIPYFKKKIINRFDYAQYGERVFSFKGANSAVSSATGSFSSQDEMNDLVNNFSQYCTVRLIQKLIIESYLNDIYNETYCTFWCYRSCWHLHGD